MKANESPGETQRYQQLSSEVGDLFRPVGRPYHQPTSQPVGRSAPPQTGALLGPAPEAVPASATRSRSTQLAGIVVLGVVLLGLMGAAVPYLLSAPSPDRTELGQLGASQQAVAPRELPSPPSPLPAPRDTADAVIDPPGQTRSGGGRFGLPQLLRARANLLPASIVTAMQEGGMTDGVFKTTTIGSTTIGMFALSMPDQQAATTVAEAIAAAQFESGFMADDNRSLRGMTVLGGVPSSSQSAVYRAVYVLYNRTIYVEVFGSNRDAVLTTFDAVIKQQVAHAPPTARTGR